MDEGETGERTKVVTTELATGIAWRCRRCGQVLGWMEGERLWLSLVVQVEAVKVRCVGCGWWQVWGRGGAGPGREGGVRSVG